MFEHTPVYGYDDEGNKVLSVDPEGVLTRFEYTATNRLAFKTENAADPDWENRRMTGYMYQYGRLVEMNLVTEDPANTPAPLGPPAASGDVPISSGLGVIDAQSYPLTFGHRTRLEYGADIVKLNAMGTEYVGVSRNNKLIGSMHLPNEQTGDPADDADILLRYTFAGQIAERFAGNGEAFRYIYDDLGRLISVETGVWDPAFPAVFTPIDPTLIPPGVIVPVPTEMIRFVEYAYDERGNLIDVIAWSDSSASKQRIAHTRMAYDGRDRLIKEWQLHGPDGAIHELKTPHMIYDWAYEPTDLGLTGADANTGYERLSSMTYPVPSVSVSPRVLTMKYGTAGSEEDHLSRLTAMQSSIGTLHLAGFEYSGSGRRTSFNYKNNKIWHEASPNTQVSSTVGLDGYDRYGRMSEVKYKSATDVLYNAYYTFDKVGNRTSALIRQMDVGASPRDNIRSVVNTYDRLHRLVGAEVGQIAYSDANAMTGASIVGGTTVHNDSWSLDRLGNWAGEYDDVTGDLIQHGRQTTGHLDSFGVPWSIANYTDYSDYDFGLTQSPDQRNKITQLSIFEQVDTDPSQDSTLDPVYDNAGRTLFDGTYGYEYDAWGRVVEISNATTFVDSVTGEVSVEYGDMLKHFVYDGFGRLIRTTSPVDDDPGDGLPAESVQSISFFYDGARRIQEIINDQVLSIAGALNSGDSGLQSLAIQSTNESNPELSSAPMSLEKGQTPEPTTRNIYREYVWGPGDRGPDELLLQTDENDDEYWCLMDGGGDLVAMATVDTGSNVDVVQQWTYDAYGATLTAEQLGTSLVSHVGHKGLFMDRLDVAMHGSGGIESPRLVPYGHTIYQNRNRSYSPSLGRFLQMDPNQTSMALLSTTASHGRGIGAISIAFSMEGMYGDGLNLYQYLGSNPWTNSDPLGLSSDPFAEIDAIIDEHIASAAAFAGALGADLAKAAIITARIASYLPFPGMGLAGDLALVVLGDQSLEAAMMGAAIGVIPGGKLMKLLGKTGLFKGIGKLASGFAKGIAGYVAKSGARGAGRLRQAGGWIARKAAKLVGIGRCGCFTATTLVLTANGAVPIVDIESGQQVLSASDDGLSQDYSSNEVGTKIVIGEAALVQLHLVHEDGSTETINTTDEHPFHVSDTNAWTRADQLLIGDRLSTISGTAQLLGVTYTTERVPVYNLSIPGSPTYYVGEHGVWVHNCKVHLGKQGKHIRGHNNYIPGRSILEADPEQLLGEAVDDMMKSFDDAKNSIMVQWNRVIGKHIDEVGNEVPTTRGTINFAQDGTFHIVPREP